MVALTHHSIQPAFVNLPLRLILLNALSIKPTQKSKEFVPSVAASMEY